MKTLNEFIQESNYNAYDIHQISIMINTDLRRLYRGKLQQKVVYNDKTKAWDLYAYKGESYKIVKKGLAKTEKELVQWVNSLSKK